MSNKKNDIKIIILITLATIVGKILGFVKDLLISYHYGSNDMTDAFFLAMSIPTILLGVFTASTDSAIIPQYDRIKMKSRKEADCLFNTIILWLSIVCAIVSLAEYVFPEFFIRIFAYEFSVLSLEYAIRYLRIFSPIGLLHMLYCFYCTYNIAYRDTKMRTLLAFMTNLIVVIALLCFPDSELLVAAYSFLLASLIGALLPIVQSFRLGYKVTSIVPIKHPEIKQFRLIFIPIMGSALLNDIQQYVDKNLASGISGGISSLTYGSKLINIFDSIFIVGISTIILPRLSHDRLSGSKSHFVRTSTLSVKYIICALIPIFTILFVWSREIISFIFERGEFNSNNTTVVSNVLKTYSFLIILMPLQAIFSKFFHAMEETRIPFYISLAGVVLNVALSVVLGRTMGITGISLATSIAGVFTLLIFGVSFVKRVGWAEEYFNIKMLLMLMFCSIVSGIVSKATVSSFNNTIMKLIFGSVIIGSLFMGLYWWILNNEIRSFLSKLIKKK